MEISAALWALWLGKDFTLFFTYYHIHITGNHRNERVTVTSETVVETINCFPSNPSRRILGLK